MSQSPASSKTPALAATTHAADPHLVTGRDVYLYEKAHPKHTGCTANCGCGSTCGGNPVITPTTTTAPTEEPAPEPEPVPATGGAGACIPGGGSGNSGGSGGGDVPPILRHYTSPKGFQGILSSLTIWASKKANNPKDARHGDGVYLTDLTTAAGFTIGQIAYRLFGQPMVGHKMDYYVDINVEGLNVQKVAPYIYLIPTNADSIGISGRIVGSGRC